MNTSLLGESIDCPITPKLGVISSKGLKYKKYIHYIICMLRESTRQKNNREKQAAAQAILDAAAQAAAQAEAAAQAAALLAAQAAAQAEAATLAAALTNLGAITSQDLGNVPVDDVIYKYPSTELQHDFHSYNMTLLNGLLQNNALFANFQESILGTTKPAEHASLLVNDKKPYFYAGTDQNMIETVFGNGNSLASFFSVGNTGIPYPVFIPHLNQEQTGGYTKRRSGWRYRKALSTTTGQTLLTELGIESGSVLVFDVDPGLMKQIKQIGTPTNSEIYVYSNPLIMADPAFKPNPLRDSRGHFRRKLHPGEVQCYGITDTREQRICHVNTLENAAYREHLLFNNSEVISQYIGGEITQIWDDNPRGQSDPTLREVVSAHTANSITQIEKDLKYDLSIADCKKVRRKRSGDWFQAWTVVMSLSIVIRLFFFTTPTAPLPAQVYLTPNTIPTINPQPEKIYLVTHDHQLICYSLYALAIKRILFKLHIGGNDYFISMIKADT